MDQEKLDLLAVEYKLTRDGGTFREIYEIVFKKLSRKIEYEAAAHGLDRDDLVSELGMVIWSVAQTFDHTKGSFLPRVRVRFNSRKIDLLRMEARRKRGRLAEEDTDTYGKTGLVDIDVATVNMTEDFNRESPPSPEEIAIKRRDQRYLVSSLVANEDDFVKKVAQLLPKFKTPTALATELHVGHSKVIRVLDRLRRKYDATRYGDLSDYLTA